jgi:rod shape-determining protein MreC
MFWVGLAILLMVLDQRAGCVQQLRSALSMPLSLLEYAVSSPVQLIDKMGALISTHDSLVSENINLRSEQLLLKAQVQRLLAIESENNQLKALLRSSAQVHGKVLISQLLAVDTDPFVNQVLLDKGFHDGVFVGQPVLDATGVMGKVIQVGPLTSRVLLVNDTHSGIPIQNTRNGIRAIAVGDSYSGKLKLVNVPQTVDVKIGDMLVTSGLGEHYPAGYPVGVVIAVLKDPGMQFSTIEVEPSAHTDRSRQVLLVWPNQNQKVVELPHQQLPLPQGNVK